MLKFPTDPSFQLLSDALRENRIEEAFRGAHTLKGICINLGFTKLYETASALTEILRAGKTEGTEALFSELSTQYHDLISKIAMLDQ